MVKIDFSRLFTLIELLVHVPRFYGTRQSLLRYSARNHYRIPIILCTPCELNVRRARPESHRPNNKKKINKHIIAYKTVWHSCMYTYVILVNSFAEGFNGLNVQVICRLVEYEEVRHTHAHAREGNPWLLSSRQTAHGLQSHITGYPETAQLSTVLLDRFTWTQMYLCNLLTHCDSRGSLALHII